MNTREVNEQASKGTGEQEGRQSNTITRDTILYSEGVSQDATVGHVRRESTKHPSSATHLPLAPANVQLQIIDSGGGMAESLHHLGQGEQVPSLWRKGKEGKGRVMK